MLVLTEKAVLKIKEFADAEGLALSVRFKTFGGGCSGLQNDMFFDEIVDEKDEVIEQDGIKLLIDELSIQYLDGSTVDYVESDFSSGFKFNNPNSKSSCGCGNSYAV